MTLTEMHVWFRQYAQQMGMQNVRAILPEQIDLLINTSISDTVNQIIKENIGVTNDRVITDNSKIGQINALRTLYKVKTFNIDSSVQESDISYAGSNTIYKFDLDHVKKDANSNEESIKMLFLADLSIDYIYKENTLDKNTNLFPVRIIDDIFLADTLNDFILKPRFRSPIAVTHDNNIYLYVDLHVGNDFTVTPNILRVSYIAQPAIVKYVEDIGGTNKECDLPEYLHIDIVKHAVDLYHIAISGALNAAQQQNQSQQQENVRNNYRYEGNAQQG